MPEKRRLSEKKGTPAAAPLSKTETPSKTDATKRRPVDDWPAQGEDRWAKGNANRSQYDDSIWDVFCDEEDEDHRQESLDEWDGVIDWDERCPDGSRSDENLADEW